MAATGQHVLGAVREAVGREPEAGARSTAP